MLFEQWAYLFRLRLHCNLNPRRSRNSSSEQVFHPLKSALVRILASQHGQQTKRRSHHFKSRASFATITGAVGKAQGSISAHANSSGKLATATFFLKWCIRLMTQTQCFSTYQFFPKKDLDWWREQRDKFLSQRHLRPRSTVNSLGWGRSWGEI